MFDPTFGVVGIEVIPYALPFREQYATARGVLRRREMVLVRLHTGDGIVGLGEGVPLSLRGGGSIEQVTTELRRFATDFHDASDRERRTLFLDANPLSPPARCAFSTAWGDILGKRTGHPAWKLLGAREASPVECNATLSAGQPERVAEEALAWAAEGFTTFKLKLGLANDVGQVEAVRNAVGPEAKLRVDINGTWGPAEAVSKLARMLDFDLELVEQPCGTLQELATVRREVNMPVVADESISSPFDAQEAVELEACDYATVKLSKVGGEIAAKQVAGTIPAYLSSALDGPVGIAAAAHVAQAFYSWPEETHAEPKDPGVAHGLATQHLFADTIALRECQLRDGFLHLPEGPGLGVEIDDAALERHRL